jgi:putative SOS response-associated peptidase YedK
VVSRHRARRLHDRQPVIIDEGAAESWIANGNIDVPNDLDDAVQIWPVTTRMNSSRYEEPDSVQSLTEPSQG